MSQTNLKEQCKMCSKAKKCRLSVTCLCDYNTKRTQFQSVFWPSVPKAVQSQHIIKAEDSAGLLAIHHMHVGL